MMMINTYQYILLIPLPMTKTGVYGDILLIKYSYGQCLAALFIIVRQTLVFWP